MPLAIVAFVLFVVAGILELTGQHLNWVIWLLIFGGALVAAAQAWGYGGSRYFHRGTPAGTP